MPASDFAACIASQLNQYCAALAAAVATAGPMVAPSQVVAASVFTTMSATAWMEKARGRRDRACSVPDAHSGGRLCGLQPGQDRSGTGRPANPTQFNDITVPLDPTLLAGHLPELRRVCSNRRISRMRARRSTPRPPAPMWCCRLPVNDIVFSVYLPSRRGPRPEAVPPIFGHGLGDSRLGGPTAVAASLAESGIATIAITAVGHGYGPESTIVLVEIRQSGHRAGRAAALISTATGRSRAWKAA